MDGEAEAAGAAGPKAAYWPLAGVTWAWAVTLPAWLKEKVAGVKPPTVSAAELRCAVGWPSPPSSTELPAGITISVTGAPLALAKVAVVPVPTETDCSVSVEVPVLLMLTETFAGPVCWASASAEVTTTMLLSLRVVPMEVEALSGFTSSVSGVFPAAQADSGTIAARTRAAMAPRRRLRLTAAASPWITGRVVTAQVTDRS